MARSQLIQQIDYLFNPSSIAVVGASNTFGKWGFSVLSQIWTGSKGRKIYPINSRESEVFGLRSYTSITEVPEPVELAVVAIPAEGIPSIMEACVGKGVKSVIIESAGFAESGNKGAQIEWEIVTIAKRGGIRLLGPNCMGVLNISAGLSTMPTNPLVDRGEIGLICQSGNVGAQILQCGKEKGTGFSKFVSTGNEADLRLEDFLEYLAQDGETKVIAAYVEGLREPQRFLKLAKEITVKKPIVVMKAGTSRDGVKAARSHTGVLAGTYEVYRAAFKQAGVVMVEEVSELIDVAIALGHQILPQGRGLAILSGGGGFGVMAVDACHKLGVEIAELSSSTIEKLSALLPPYWSGTNPVDMAGTVLPTYPCLRALLEDENVDAILSLSSVGLSIPLIDMEPMVPPAMRQQVAQTVKDQEEAEIRNLSQLIEQIDKHHKPIMIAQVLSEVRRSSQLHKFLHQRGIRVYPSVQAAVRVLAHLSDYGEYLKQSSEMK